MNDLISRKALLKEIEAQYDLNYGDIMTNPIGFYEMVDCQETIHVDSKWMPVSERLPKEGRYLVTTVYGEVKESEYDLKKWWQIDNSTISLEWKEEPIKVVAWQPLPEPYKELATDNNVVTKSGKGNNVLTIGDKMRECGQRQDWSVEE